ncbi:MAG: hypothetical protein HYV07_17165 [Deltaproteobacteria bacterium]|nr:hypothetical protein [Deltaproteobacteria bacterium]
MDTGYRGEPILRLEGVLSSFGPGGVPVNDEDSVLVSVFWIRDFAVHPPALVEQSSVSTALRFPRGFELRVFEPPSSEHFLLADDRVAIGLVLVYADRNADGSFDPRIDALIGGNLRRGLVYGTSAIAAQDSPTHADVPLGFSLLDLPLGGCASTEHRPPQGQHGRPVLHCSGEGVCPEGFVCDRVFAICVPADQFEVVIGGDFDLMRPICR